VVDAALDRAGAPGHGQAAGDGVEVLLQAHGERCDARQACAAGAGDPLRQVLPGEFGEHGGERADLVRSGCQEPELTRGRTGETPAITKSASSVTRLADGRPGRIRNQAGT
jgi:hypothetical protein